MKYSRIAQYSRFRTMIGRSRQEEIVSNESRKDRFVLRCSSSNMDMLDAYVISM